MPDVGVENGGEASAGGAENEEATGVEAAPVAVVETGAPTAVVETGEPAPSTGEAVGGVAAGFCGRLSGFARAAAPSFGFTAAEARTDRREVSMRAAELKTFWVAVSYPSR